MLVCTVSIYYLSHNGQTERQNGRRVNHFPPVMHRKYIVNSGFYLYKIDLSEEGKQEEGKGTHTIYLGRAINTYMIALAIVK